MEVEARYLTVLGGATKYVLAGGRLVLSGSAGEMVFERPAP
jgi:heat shock protein HslJ